MTEQLTVGGDLEKQARPSRSAAAERMKVLRQRRRDGLRVVPLEVRTEETAILVARKLLPPDKTRDAVAIADALGKFLDGALTMPR